MSYPRSQKHHHKQEWILGSRKSDLARIQAYLVAGALKSSNPNLDIQFVFKSSLGDQNAHDPLWQMPEKGVFTQDLTKDLISGAVDFVVHSWKDLPVERNPKTTLVATLPRAASQDLLLLKKESIQGLSNARKLRVLSSSPRRALQIHRLNEGFLPVSDISFEMQTVRGTVGTRIEKFLNGHDVDGLFLAKAALDRMSLLLGLEDNQNGSSATANACEFFLKDQGLVEASQKWRELSEELKKRSVPILLPLEVFPTAAAQGAVVIEVRSDDQERIDFFKQMNCEKTWREVEKERAILKSYGGGCHQAIGVSVLSSPVLGAVSLERTVVCGEIEENEQVRSVDYGYSSVVKDVAKDVAKEFLPELKDIGLWLTFQDLVEKVKTNVRPAIEPECGSGRYLNWLSRGDVFNRDLFHKLTVEQELCFTPGTRTWKEFARKGIWIHGCSEGFGEREWDQMLSKVFLDSKIRRRKWSFAGADEENAESFIASYTIKSHVKPANDPVWQELEECLNQGLKPVVYVSSPQDLSFYFREISEVKSYILAYPPGKTAKALESHPEFELLKAKHQLLPVWGMQHFRSLKDHV